MNASSTPKEPRHLMIIRHPQYTTERILIWGKTYPELSSNYWETVCTGGVLQDGRPIRIYPIPYRYYRQENQFAKYQWITARIAKSTSDPRPESYRIDIDTPIIAGESIPPDKSGWAARRMNVFKSSSWQFETMDELQYAERQGLASIGVIRPKEIRDVRLVDRPAQDAIDYRTKMEEIKRKKDVDTTMMDLFRASPSTPDMQELEFVSKRVLVDWVCSDSNCTGHSMQIIDWEVVETQRKFGFEKSLALVQDHLDSDMYDIRFFLGNLRIHPTSFMIVGLWYPRVREQQMLF